MVLALPLFAIGAYGGFAVTKGFITGQVYSLAVAFGSSTIVHRSSAPVEYWTTVGFDLFGGIGTIVVSIATLILSYIELKRQIAEQKKRASDTNSIRDNL